MKRAWPAALVFACATAIDAGVHPDHAWLAMSEAPGTRVDLGSAIAKPPAPASPLEEGHHVVELLYHVDLKIGADGILRERRVYARRFLTAEGVRQSGTLGFGARSEVDRVTIEAAYSQQPDGSIRDLDLADIQVFSDADTDLFSDAYVVSAPFTGLAPGSIAILVFERRVDANAWPLPWSYLFYPRSFVPIRHFRVDVAWDEGAPAPIAETDMPGLRCEPTGERSTRCELRNVAPLLYDPDVQSWPDLAPNLIVSQRHSWSELVHRERGLVESALSENASLDALVQRLVGHVSRPEERLRILHRFVADEVRYVGRFEGVSAVAPHASDETLDRRYGDCKDKVVLFLDLARRAGLDAHAVLVGTDRHRLARLIQPSWLFFDHMIACVHREGGDVCVDLTSPYAETGHLPAANHGAVALDLRDGVDAPRILAQPRYSWEIAVEGHNTVECDGRISETLERRFLGALAIRFRSTLGDQVPQDRLRWAEDGYRDVIGEKLSPRVSLTGVDGVDGPLVVHSITEFPSRGSNTDGLVQYSEPDVWLTHYAEWFVPENRHQPYDFLGLELTTRFRYSLCPKIVPAALGAKLDFYFDFGSLTRSYRKDGDEVVAETRLEIPSQLVAVEDLDRFRRSLRAALGQSRLWFGIQPADGRRAP